jgi:hypothetical protein
MTHATFDRHDVIEAAKRTVAPAQTPIVCEGCGKVLATLTNGYNFWFNSGVGVPGSPDLAAISCDAGQHWACSLPCWYNVAHACIDQHMGPTIQSAHDLLEERRIKFEATIQEKLNVSSSH